MLNTLKPKISPNFLSRITCTWSYFSEEGNLLNKYRRNSNSRVWLDLTEKLIAWYFFSSPPILLEKKIACALSSFCSFYVYCWCVFMWVWGKGDTSCETSHAMSLWNTRMLILTLAFLLLFQDAKMTGNMLANFYNLCASCDSSLQRPVNSLQTQLSSPEGGY